MHPLADTGRVIAGRYRLETPIGRGAMGVVWRARDQLLDRDVALKEVQIAETLTDDERANAYQRTLREAKTAARLNHPGVVTVYDVAEDRGAPWIVMQLVSAQSLDQLLAASGPLSPRRAAEVGRQLLSALSVAHAAGVMHRDVKPSNVLLGQDDRAVLTDFGIATFQGDPRLTQTGMVMGSPGFTAPERIRGEDATPASDLWSLGATLFAAVEGHGPFEKRGGAITTMSAIINEDAPLAPTAGALGPVIAALLRREPSDRPDTATATRMITDVLPLLPARTGGDQAGYVATSLSPPHSASPPHPPPVWPAPPPSPPPSGSPGWAAAADLPGPLAASDTQGASGGSGTAATTPQPVLGDAGRFEPPVTEFDRPKSGYDLPPTEYRPPTEYDRPRGSGSAPPDFSSWYDPAPRSGAAPSAQPWSGAGPGSAGAGPGSAGARSGSAGAAGSAAAGSAPWSGSPGPSRSRAAAAPRRRRTGLWLALVLLAVLGAGAGAATIVLLRHSTTSTPSGGSSSPGTSSTGTGTLAPPETAPQIVNAVNEPNTGPLPAGWRTVTRHATGTQKAGFTIAAPSSWSPSTSGYQNYLYDSSANANILIDLTPHTYPNDMLREAQYIKSQSLAQNRFPGYKQQGLQAETIRGTPGAWWKFTWLDKGVSQEAIDLLFVLQTPAGPQSYALYMTAPESMWNQMRPIFDEMVETFAPLT
ncbi:MAG TPA: serine/threonine-protein kinase [Streptosporangiaceae bacterium]|nr:serine/threonine-protein kinase [Streptosporangiaceae bacterium]